MTGGGRLLPPPPLSSWLVAARRLLLPPCWCWICYATTAPIPLLPPWSGTPASPSVTTRSGPRQVAAAAVGNTSDAACGWCMAQLLLDKAPSDAIICLSTTGGGRGRGSSRRRQRRRRRRHAPALHHHRHHHPQGPTPARPPLQPAQLGADGGQSDIRPRQHLRPGAHRVGACVPCGVL